MALFESQGAPLTFKQIPWEDPKPGEVVIKTLACGVCHSDTVVQHGIFGNSFPIIPGHEVIGEVVAVGDGEKQWKVGDRMGGAWHGGHDGKNQSSCRYWLILIENQEHVDRARADCTRCAKTSSSTASPAMEATASMLS